MDILRPTLLSGVLFGVRAKFAKAAWGPLVVLVSFKSDAYRYRRLTRLANVTDHPQAPNYHIVEADQKSRDIIKWYTFYTRIQLK